MNKIRIRKIQYIVEELWSQVILQVTMKDAERRKREILEMSTATSTSRCSVRLQTTNTRMGISTFEICDYIKRQMGVHKSSYILWRICLTKTNTKALYTQILRKCNTAWIRKYWQHNIHNQIESDISVVQLYTMRHHPTVTKRRLLCCQRRVPWLWM